MISQSVEYALRAIVTLAQNLGASCTTKTISEMAHVPSAYLSKLMQSLVRGGLVTSQRGVNGGFVLKRDPQELTIWDVVDVIEPLKRIRHCPLNLESHASGLCPLHCYLDQTIAATEKTFREKTIAELLDPPNRVAPLCGGRKCITGKSRKKQEQKAKKSRTT